MSTLERAIEIAARAHGGKLDKAGAPYILHPLRVMLRLATTVERIVAVLHDVVEDSEVSLQHLIDEGFSDTVVEAIDAVTKLPGEAYEDFMRRASLNPIGRRVKLVDLEDNSNLSRIPNPTERDYERLARYHRAIATIRSVASG